jgi:chorismate--pyruvate lyase
VAPGLRAWLAAPGSLTLLLARAWGGVSVRLLAQRRGSASAQERRLLRLPAHHPLWVRQVLLSGPAGQQVQARSVCAQGATHGAWRALRGLGTQPLARLLYARSDIRRSALTAAALAPRSPRRRALARVAGPGAGLSGRGLWQRQSVFERSGQRLLVSEYFDPAQVRHWPRP